MWVSQKTEYALRAMLELARRSGQAQLVRSAEIAETQSIPLKFLELILVELRNSRLISSQRGSVGGHRLAKSAREISIGDILRAVDNPFDENARKADKDDTHDPFGFVFKQIDHNVNKIVDSVTLEEVLFRSSATMSMPDFTI